MSTPDIDIPLYPVEAMNLMDRLPIDQKARAVIGAAIDAAGTSDGPAAWRIARLVMLAPTVGMNLDEATGYTTNPSRSQILAGLARAARWARLPAK